MKKVLLLSACLLVGCGDTGRKQGAVAIENPQPRGGVVADLGPVVIGEAEVRAFGESMAKALRDGKHSALWDRFDQGAFYERSLAGKLAEIENSDLADQFIKDEVVSLVQDLIAGLMGSVRGSDLAYVRYLDLKNDEYLVYLRRTNAWYFDYFILRTRTDPRGKFYITDFRESELVGEALSEFCLAFYGPILDVIDKIDPSTIENMEGKTHPDIGAIMEEIGRYSMIQNAAQGGNYREALTAFYNINTEITQQYFAQKSLLSILQAAGEQQVDIRRTAKKLDRRWPTKLGTMRTLMLHYHFEHQYESALAVVEKYQAAVGNDPAWMIARAALLTESGEAVEGKELLLKHADVLKELRSYYVYLAGAHAAAKNFDLVAATLKAYEATFDEKVSYNKLESFDWASGFKLSPEGQDFFAR